MDKEKQEDCIHEGHYSAPAQNVLASMGAVMIIISMSCSQCGKLWTNLNPVPLDDEPPKKSDLIKPRPPAFS